MVYATYLGGSYYDGSWGSLVDVDDAGNLYAAGSTRSTDFPLADELQTTFGGANWDTFVVQLDPTGSSLLFSTYLGGSSDEIPYSIDLLGPGDMMVAGQTGSADFPTVGSLGPLRWQDAFATRIALGCVGSPCGDCNGDGNVTVLDAFVAMRHSVGQGTLTGVAFSRCNVTGVLEPDPLAVVDALDAEAIARFAVGLSAALACC